MARNITFNGVVYTVPDVGDDSWGLNLTNFFVAIPQGALQKSGGTFTLSADVDFGGSYGLLSSYLKSRGTNPASSGLIRLNLTDTIAFRNNANSADLALAINGSDQLTFNGSAIYPGGITALTGDVTATGPGSVASTIGANKVLDTMIRQSAGLSIIGRASNSTGNVADITAGTDGFVLKRSGTALTFALLTNSNIDPAAAIVYSKLALAASIVNADISGSAAIAYAKLNLASSIVNADVSASAAIAYSKLNLALSVVNGDISASAAIALSKLAALSTGKVLVSDGSGIISASSVTSTTLGFLDATSSIQTQINTKLPTTITTTGDMIYSSSGTTAARLPIGSSGQVLKVIGGTPSWSTFSGGINYASGNPDAEADTTGWSTYADGAAVPVDGTGGSPTATFTRSTSSPLRGTASFLYTTGALGNGASYAFTIDSADQAKALQISFDYSVSGTTALGDYTVYIYDVTNAVMTQVIPYQIPSAVSGTQYSFKGTYQSASNSTSYRLVINQAVASPAGNLKLDNVYIGPQGVSYTSPMSDWVSYTSTVTNLPATNKTFYWRRIGDSMEIKGAVGVTGAATGAISVTIPSWAAIDYTKLEGSNGTVGGGYTAVGLVSMFDNTGTQLGRVQVQSTSTSTLTFFGDDSVGNWAATIPATWANGMELHVQARVPIVGWSSSAAVSQSDSSEGRVVAARVRLGSTQTIGTASSTKIAFNTVESDSHSAFNTSTNTYTVPVSGYYSFTGIAALEASTATYDARIDFNVNGSTTDFYDNPKNGTANQRQGMSYSFIKNLKAGDAITVNVLQSSGANLGLSGDSVVTGITSLNIQRISGNQSIMASESVNARYTTAAGQSIPNITYTIVDFGTKNFDSHGSVTTGASWKYTANCAGKFRVSGQVLFASATSSTTQGYVLLLFKNGSLQSQLARTVGTGGTTLFGAGGSDSVQLNAGDYIDLRAYQDTGGSRSLYADASYNYVAVERVGN